jgi:hypothetical protein
MTKTNAYIAVTTYRWITPVFIISPTLAKKIKVNEIMGAVNVNMVVGTVLKVVKLPIAPVMSTTACSVRMASTM